MNRSASRQKYDIHPDFRGISRIRPPLGRKKVVVIQRGMRLFSYRQRSDREVRVERVRVPSGSGAAVRALLFVPKAEKTKGCLLFFHGGGYAFPAAQYHYRLARTYAAEVGCRVLFPDYRLAPENPFPAAVDDCFAAYQWMRGREPDSPVAVCGDSAGGTLSMAVCLMAHDRRVPVPCAQLLTYPYVGHCGRTESMELYQDAPLLSSRDMAQYEEWYVPDPNAGKQAYRSPIESESFDFFPATYIETAEYDGLRDGAILYAEKLRENGIRVELHNTRGTVHGFDMRMKSEIVKKQTAERIRFLKSVFSAAETAPDGAPAILAERVDCGGLLSIDPVPHYINLPYRPETRDAGEKNSGV